MHAIFGVTALAGLLRQVFLLQCCVHRSSFTVPAARRAFLALLPPPRSSLNSLTLTYGLDNVGMEYDKSLFGIKLLDCRYLARGLEATETLTYLNLSANSIDDDKLRMLASGLVDNLSITHLDLSHNKVRAGAPGGEVAGGASARGRAGM